MRGLATALGLALLLAARGHPSDRKVSPRAYELLTRADAQRGRGELEAAGATLRRLLDGAARSEYERALGQNMLGYVLLSLERTEAAARALEACLAPEVLPAEVARATRYTLAQLHLALSRPARAAELLEAWLRDEAAPRAEALALLASACSRAGKLERAAVAMRAALDASPTPPEDWLAFLAGLHLERGRERAAAAVLEERLRIHPGGRRAWLELASVQLSRGTTGEALAVLALGRLHGVLELPEDHLRLARLYLQEEIPHEAALLLEGELEGGGLSRTPQVLDLLTAARALSR